MKKLVINKSFYYSCGRHYSWKEDGFSEIGLGIARHWLRDNKEIIVNVDNQDYHLDCTEALKFINKYRCYETIKGSLIGYISKDLLTKLT